MGNALHQTPYPYGLSHRSDSAFGVWQVGRFGGFTDRIVADSFRKRSEREGSVGVVVVAVGLFGGEQGAIDAAQGDAEGFQQMVRHQHLLG